MDAFALYLLLCGLTIASPGPGVLLTVNNALLLQWRGALPGILGVVLGILLVAILASTALGALVSSSPRALQGLQLLGALYLGWLGLSRWCQGSLPDQWTGRTRPAIGVARRLRQGMLVSLTNPKLIIFFLALFPPFIQADRPMLPQLVLLVASFCVERPHSLQLRRGRGSLEYPPDRRLYPRAPEPGGGRTLSAVRRAAAGCGPGLS